MSDLRSWQPLGRRPRQPLNVRLTPHELVTLVLDGDLSLMLALRSVPHEVLVIDCSGKDLHLRTETVQGALLQEDDEHLAAWVFFVREGHCNKPSRPVTPLTIARGNCWQLDAWEHGSDEANDGVS